MLVNDNQHFSAYKMSERFEDGTDSHYLPADVKRMIHVLNTRGDYQSKSDVVQTAVRQLWEHDTADKEISSYKRELQRIEEEIEDLRSRKEDKKEKLQAARERRELQRELEEQRESRVEERVDETIQDIARIIEEKGEEKARQAAHWRGVKQEGHITKDELMLRAHKRLDG